MATNKKGGSGVTFRWTNDSGGNLTSGTYRCLASGLPIVLLEDIANGSAGAVETVAGPVYDLSVLAEDNGGAAAVSVGEKVFDDSGTINVDLTNGVHIGYALEAIAAGSTDTIKVLLHG